MSFDEIKEPLTKVLEALHRDRSKIAKFTYGKTSITAERLDQAIGKHMCDDRPECFGITEQEGHMIREYFQERGAKYGWRDYIPMLHKEFSDIMDEEDPRYIRDTNDQRKKDGLAPI